MLRCFCLMNKINAIHNECGGNSMRESLTSICKKYIEKRDMLKNVFKLDNNYIIAVCAANLCESEAEVTSGRLEACKTLLSCKTGIFSNFRGNASLPIMTLLAEDDAPQQKLEKAMAIYEILKKYFWGTEYLTLVSIVLADMVSVQEAEKYAIRGKNIYELMKKEHPFLTSSEDSVFAVLMAFSEKSDYELINDMEAYYELLKSKFSSSNDMQSLSHVLALTEGSASEKCQRIFTIYDDLKNAGKKYGKYYELTVLGSLSVLDIDSKVLVQDILNVDAFLEQQKGYGFWGIDSKTRLMHAAMLVACDYSKDSNMSTAAMTGTLAMVAAQQAAMCAVIASTAAMTAANN